MADVACTRCGREAPQMAKRPPLGEPLAELVQASVCADCWKDWEEMEVMVINEHRLNFMDPEAAVVLERHLREFLVLPAADTEG